LTEELETVPWSPLRTDCRSYVAECQPFSAVCGWWFASWPGAERRSAGVLARQCGCWQLPLPGRGRFYAVFVETLAFLFTDVEGSTALLRRVGEDVYAEVLAGHHALIRSALVAHDGREVVMQGDGFFAVFSSPRACVAAVLEMQRVLEAQAWPAGEHVRVRMGMHCGEASQTAAGLVGLEIHRAARTLPRRPRAICGGAGHHSKHRYLRGRRRVAPVC
jgi:hypothetical protein